VAAKLVEGPVQLGFHAWDIDNFGERDILPYHVKFCLEGVPHHAWLLEVAEKVLVDEAIIQFIDEDSLRWSQ
jgi:hypothetical protein